MVSNVRRNKMVFKKGFDENRNYKGRPKNGETFAEALRNEAEKLIESKGITKREALAQILWLKVLNDRDLKAMDMIMDRIDGKAKSSMDITSGGEPIQEVRQTIVDPRDSDS